MLASASVWPPRWAALLLSAAAALSVAYGALQWRLETGTALPAVAEGSREPALDSAAVARALGAVTAPAPGAAVDAPQGAEPSRFVLLGVVGQDAAGRALVSVDGKPAKPVAVGEPVGDGWVLHAARGRVATLRRNGAELELTLPLLPVPAVQVKKAL